MSIVPVTFYKVRCDEPGCGRETADSGGEYAAWASEDQALSDWTDGDEGVGLPDGRTFCRKHIPADYCPYDDDGHEFVDGEWCAHCSAAAP